MNRLLPNLGSIVFDKVVDVYNVLVSLGAVRARSGLLFGP